MKHGNNWITRGWFEWESEGYPFWGNMHHSQSWWNYRHLDNIHFVHYNDLLTNLPDEIRAHSGLSGASRLSDDGDCRDSAQPQPRSHARKWRSHIHSATISVAGWGAKTFFFKGTNGRWKEVLSPDELALYEETASTLTHAGMSQMVGARSQLEASSHKKAVRVELAENSLLALSILAWLLRRYSEPENRMPDEPKSSNSCTSGETPMRYLLLIYTNEQEYDAMPEAEREADFNNHYAYSRELGESGAMRGGEALLPTTTATTVRVQRWQELDHAWPLCRDERTTRWLLYGRM